MLGFYTINGSRYYMDSMSHIVSGGKLRQPMYYCNAQVIIGCPAIIRLLNGAVIQTSRVKGYF
jgi:hypothetical protein